MSHKTKSMAARDNSLPHVNSSNELVGTMNPLKLFFCKHGMTLDVGTPANSQMNSAAGGFFFQDADLALGVDPKMFAINGSTQLFEIDNPTTRFNFGTIPASTDVLIIAAGTPSAIASRMRFELNATSSIKLRPGDVAGTGRSSIDDGFGGVDTAGVGFTQVIGTEYTAILASDIRDTGSDVNGRLYTRVHKGDNATLITEDLTLVNSFGDMDFDVTNLLMSGDFSAIGMFLFPNETLPTNWEYMANMMAQEWLAENYVFPEGWANL